jgi:hypothetical protein
MRRALSALFMGAVLCCPLVMQAADKDNHRYYDSDRKDYHEWNAGEDRAWHHWLDERHSKDHDWSKASKREQRDYWKWRHDHMDWH